MRMARKCGRASYDTVQCPSTPADTYTVVGALQTSLQLLLSRVLNALPASSPGPFRARACATAVEHWITASPWPNCASYHITGRPPLVLYAKLSMLLHPALQQLDWKFCTAQSVAYGLWGNSPATAPASRSWRSSSIVAQARHGLPPNRLVRGRRRNCPSSAALRGLQTSHLQHCTVYSNCTGAFDSPFTHSLIHSFTVE